MRKGTFFVLSGPSGSGKGTVLKKVLAKDENLAYSVSATTRAPREGEIEGKNYFFKSRAEFERLIKEGAFIEYNEMFGNYYGTLAAQVEEAVEKGFNIILEIDPVGARNVRFSYPDAVLMFLVAPSFEHLKQRLTGRGTEEGNALRVRLEAAVSEMENASLYDYMIVNEDIDSAACDILSIVRAENLKISNNTEILSQIKGGIKL